MTAEPGRMPCPAAGVVAEAQGGGTVRDVGGTVGTGDGGDGGGLSGPRRARRGRGSRTEARPPPPYTAPVSRPSTPAAPGSLYAQFGPALVAEKLRVLRTIRALDRAGIDPSEVAAVREPLVRLAEVDDMLTAILDGYERFGCEPAASGDLESGASIPQLLRVAEALRGDVADALASPDRKAFERCGPEVMAIEAEVWMQVDEFRARQRSGGRKPRAKAGDAGRFPLTDVEARHAADATWGEGKEPPRPAGRKQVAEAERASLPPDDAPLVAWFERLPVPWLQGVAIVHDLPTAGTIPLVERLAARLSASGSLERILVERLGASEREKLAILLAVGPLPLGAATSDASEVFEVGWDWTLGMPAPVGSKLRAVGLVHVGRVGRSRVASIPPPLRGPLAAALVAVDPDAAQAPNRAAGSLRATASEGAPFAEPALAHWKAIDKSLSAVFESWLEKGALSERAVIPFFGPGQRVLETDAQREALCEYVLFDWRASPGAATVGERALTTTKFPSPEHKAVAAATVAARPAVYRVERTNPGTDVDVVPVFPPGPAVRVTDRGFSHTALPGIWVPMRVYPAGPYHFCRFAGDPIRHAQQPLLERALLRGARRTDPATWIAEDPAAFYRTLRAHSS